MKNGSWIEKSGIALMILGGVCIAFILLSVMITGSWSKTPEIVQIWGSFVRSISDIPIIGNFTIVLWGVFLVPGFLIMRLGKKLEYDANVKNGVEKSPSKGTSTDQLVKGFNRGIVAWERNLDLQYGDILRSSEIIEDIDRIYFCSRVGKNLIAGWDIQNSRWLLGTQRQKLDGLAFSTPNRFEELVFGGMEETEAYARKQCLIEYILFGIPNDEFKTLKKSIGQGKKVEFSVSAMIWNSIIIGNGINCEIYCKIFEEDRESELVELCSLSSEDSSLITLEMVSGDTGKELFSCGTKELNGYYT